ncbi:hypothetical protein S83_006966 [Arachis hypogaea]
MNCLIWNVRGAASNAFRRTFKDMYRHHRPDLVVLLETKCSGSTVTTVIQQLGLKYHIVEETQGFAGGIWVCWNKDDFYINAIENHNQYIYVKVQEPNVRKWYFTAVYASPHSQIRRNVWMKLRNIANSMEGDWLIAGDFNEIKVTTEKKGGVATDRSACNLFANWINSCGLIDLGFVGSRYTWRGPKWEGLDRVFKKLDRALSNSFWRTRFDEAKVEILARTNLDHHPLLIKMANDPNSRRDRPFRFEAM